MSTEIEGFLPDDSFFQDEIEDEVVEHHHHHNHSNKHHHHKDPFDNDLVIDNDIPNDHFFEDNKVVEEGFENNDFFELSELDKHMHHLHLHKHHKKGTPFQTVYDFFLAGITDDMFMELTIDDTLEILEEIMLAAIPYFEFARHDLFDMDLEEHHFNFELTIEEMMILRQYMIAQWIGYQLATIDLIKQKYSGSDFKFTSQASHIKQLQAMKKEYETQGFHLQRLYKRRTRKKDGSIGSTMAMIMEAPRS